MSRELLKWARQQDLARGPFNVLITLAFFHSDEQGCYPSQSKIAKHSRYARSTVNEHLSSLERLGMIRRTRRKDKYQRSSSTLYFFPRFNCPPNTEENTQSGSVSESWTEPCPVSRNTRVQFPDTKQDTKTKLTTSPQKGLKAAASADETAQQIYSGITQLFRASGKEIAGPYWEPARCILHIYGWLDHFDLSAEQILDAISKHSEKFSEAPKGPKAFDKCVEDLAGDSDRLHLSNTELPEITDLPAFYAKKIQAGEYVPVNAITATTRNEILRRGLATPEKMKIFL